MVNKVLTLVMLCSSVFAFAKMGEKENGRQEKTKQSPKFSIEKGMGVKDTADGGSCITYGTYYRGDNDMTLFVEADLATLFSMGLPRCYGEGNYLV